MYFLTRIRFLLTTMLPAPFFGKWPRMERRLEHNYGTGVLVITGVAVNLDVAVGGAVWVGVAVIVGVAEGIPVGVMISVAR
jgi:hypothetical protein